MKLIKHYLDDAITTGAAKNDADIAKKLNVTRSCVSDWRSGKSAPNDEQAISLARLINKPVIELLAEAAAYRAKTDEARGYWEQIAKYSATYASAAVIGISSLICVTPAPQAQAQAQIDVKTVFIMSTWRHIQAALRKMACKAFQSLQTQRITQPATI